MARVEIEGIGKTYRTAGGATFEALGGVDLVVERGEAFSLLGPSGCGKSTLLRILAGLDAPDRGRIRMDGRDVAGLPPEKRPTAMVFQSYALFPHLDVEGNVSFGLKARKRAREEIRVRVEAALEKVGLTGMNRRRVDALSGGQQQRVALARVLAVEPSVLLMDEPLSNLDASLRRSTRSAIRSIQRELGLTMIYVTHDREEALSISDRLAIMRGGAIVEAGPPAELYERPATLAAAAFLGQRSVARAVVVGRGPEGATILAPAREDGRPNPADGRIAIAPEGVRGDAREGSVGDAAFLPSELAVATDESESGAGDGWRGTVALVSYAGGGDEIEFRLDAGPVLRAWRPSGSPAVSAGTRGIARNVAGGGGFFAGESREPRAG